jgi:hypothetical protein
LLILLHISRKTGAQFSNLKGNSADFMQVAESGNEDNLFMTPLGSCLKFRIFFGALPHLLSRNAV